MTEAGRRELEGRIETYKRRYKMVLKNMAVAVSSEIEAMQSDSFEPSTSIDSTAFQLIEMASALRSLMEVEDGER